MRNAALTGAASGWSRLSDAELVRTTADDATAFGELFDRWFDRVYDVARNIVRNDDTAAEVAQDVFLTTWQRIDQLEDPERFGGWLLRASRNRALNRLEKDRRAQPMDGEVMTGLHEQHHGSSTARDDLVGSNRLLETAAISEARDQQNMVWAAAAALGPRDASLLDLQLRHQLSPAEIADELNMTANNARQLLFRLRDKLGDAIANHQVWRDGSPLCRELALMVDNNNFDQKTNKVVRRHASRCDECGTERRRVVAPAKLFASAPIAVAPSFLKERTAAALTAEGVPIKGSSRPRGLIEHDLDPNVVPQATKHPARRRKGSLTLLMAVSAVAVAVGVVAVFARPTAESELVADSGSTLLSANRVAEPDPVVASSTTARSTSTTSVASTAPTTSTPPTTPATETTRVTAVPTRPTTVQPTTVRPTTVRPTTVPPTTVPPSSAPTTSPPTTQPPTTPSTRPLTTPSTEPPTTPSPPPPAPVIVRFTLGTPPGAIFCPNSTDVARIARWFTEETTTVTINTPNGSTSYGPSGSHTFCTTASSVVTLTATGPGGTVADYRTP